MTALPTLFVSHGAPTIALERTPAHDFLRRAGHEFERDWGKPGAILCVSAHWETDAPAVSEAPAPDTIHDFSGFPAELYRLRYPAPGAPELARRVVAILAEAGMACALDPERGLDHGAWMPLLLMWPEAGLPVAQFAIQHRLGPAHHWRLGAALAPLRREGVLILASGGAVHNVGDAMRRGSPGGAAALTRNAGAQGAPAADPPAWSRDFAAWLDRALITGAVEDLLDYRRQAPSPERAHPRDEHLLPLFVAAGAAEGEGARQVHASFDYGSLSMAAWQFGAGRVA
jgi:4,5-DOPA dioxygenase extradiol